MKKCGKVRMQMLKKWRYLLFSLLLLYFVLRITFLLQVKADIHWKTLSSRTDSHYYHLAGISVAKGEGVGKDFDLNPLYPLLIIGPFYRIFGVNIFPLRIYQIILGCFNALIFYLLLYRLFSKWIALLSLSLLAFYPPLIVYDVSILPQVLENFFLLSSLFLLIIAERRRALSFFSFVLLGAGVISRPPFLSLLPFFFWERIRREGLRRASLNLIFFILPFLPFIIVNSLHFRTFTLLRNKGGIVFLIGNNPYATGSSGMPSFYWKEISKKWEGLNPVEKDRMAYRLAFQFIRENPARFLKLLGRKTLLFWGREEIPNNVNILYARQISFLKFIPLSFAGILPLALLGIYTSIPDSRRYTLFYGGILGIYFMTILFLVVGRYRLPEIFFLIPFSGKGIEVLCRKREKKGLIILFLPLLYLMWFFTPIKNHFLMLAHPHGFIDKNSVWVVRDEDGKSPPPLRNHRYKGWLERKGEGIYKELYLPSLSSFSKAFLKMYIHLPGEALGILEVNGNRRNLRMISSDYPFWGWIKIPLPREVLKEGKNQILVERIEGKFGVFLDDKFNFQRSAFRDASGSFYFDYQDRKSHLKYIPCALGKGEFKIEVELWK